MKQVILITGVVGTGKSTVCDQLKAMDFVAYELDDLDDVLITLPEPTHSTPTKDKDNIKKQYNWVYKESWLREHIAKQPERVIIYCGVASNIDDLPKLFTKVILLTASDETIRSRLDARIKKKPSDDNKHEWTLNWKNNWEDNLIKHDAIVISTDQSLEQTIKEIAKSLFE